MKCELITQFHSSFIFINVSGLTYLVITGFQHVILINIFTLKGYIDLCGLVQVKFILLVVKQTIHCSKHSLRLFPLDLLCTQNDGQRCKVFIKNNHFISFTMFPLMLRVSCSLVRLKNVMNLSLSY